VLIQGNTHGLLPIHFGHCVPIKHCNYEVQRDGFFYHHLSHHFILNFSLEEVEKEWEKYFKRLVEEIAFWNEENISIPLKIF